MELSERSTAPAERTQAVDSGESADSIDLTPRDPHPVGGSTGNRGRRPVMIAVIVVLAVALVVVVWQGLSNATLYFRNADEAVAQRDELGDRRFRLQGTVVDGTITEEPPVVRFIVAHDGAEVEVHHRGDPPELFQAGLPVVLEGSWDPSGTFFDSDRMLVKHSEEYEAENPDRVDIEPAEQARPLVQTRR